MKFHKSKCLRIGQYWNNDAIHRRSLRFNRKKNLKHRHQSIELGLWYDYPICCIEHFSKRRSYERRSYVQEMVIKSQKRRGIFAHVLCVKCSINYLNSLKTHKMILKS